MAGISGLDGIYLDGGGAVRDGRFGYDRLLYPQRAEESTPGLDPARDRVLYPILRVRKMGLKAAVDWDVERGVKTVVIGHLFGIAQGKRLSRKHRKVSQWEFSQQQQYLSYKLKARWDQQGMSARR